MNFLYVLVGQNYEWEDISIVLTEEDAIKLSIDNPKLRVEIFNKTINNRYIPTYHYYQNGQYIETK